MRRHKRRGYPPLPEDIAKDAMGQMKTSLQYDANHIFQNRYQDPCWDACFALLILEKRSNTHLPYSQMTNEKEREDYRKAVASLRQWLNPQKHRPLLLDLLPTITAVPSKGTAAPGCGDKESAGVGQVKVDVTDFVSNSDPKVGTKYVLHSTLDDGTRSSRQLDYFVDVAPAVVEEWWAGDRSNSVKLVDRVRNGGGVFVFDEAQEEGIRKSLDEDFERDFGTTESVHIVERICSEGLEMITNDNDLEDHSGPYLERLTGNAYMDFRRRNHPIPEPPKPFSLPKVDLSNVKLSGRFKVVKKVNKITIDHLGGEYLIASLLTGDSLMFQT